MQTQKSCLKSKMIFTVEKINEVLGRDDVAKFLSERKPCVNCHKDVPIIEDTNAIKILYMAVTDSFINSGVRVNLDYYSRWEKHLNKVKLEDKRTCHGDRNFLNLLNPELTVYDRTLTEFYKAIKGGEIIKMENGRWNLVKTEEVISTELLQPEI